MTSTDAVVFALLNKVGVQDKDVLDFGCGDGRYAIRFSEMGARSVMGIDISPTMIEIANRKLGNEPRNVTFLAADGNNLSFPDHSFDTVFANFVLHHFKNALNPLVEISRVLRPGGYLISTFPVTEVQAGAEGLFNTELPTRLGKEGNFVTVYPLMKSEREIRDNFEQSGLRIIEYRAVENPDATIDPSYQHHDKIEGYKTVVCLTQKV